LAQTLAHLRNVHVDAMEENGHVVFLHKVMDGHADKSYGIHVARLAGLPEAVIEKAQIFLAELEGGSQPKAPTVIHEKQLDRWKEDRQLSFFPEENKPKAALSKKHKAILERLGSIDLLNMTPMEAMNILYELHQKVKN
jgi:DNA mismatch repair protein MutS